ncbi:hypothetical protein K456DRAFT_1935108 [Colletotrichum gloeosporioides 23]|nr:hypothetical protein K456DRAFT_1935108 [Colletotrichum gloeosporioides 23]
MWYCRHERRPDRASPRPSLPRPGPEMATDEGWNSAKLKGIFAFESFRRARSRWQQGCAISSCVPHLRRCSVYCQTMGCLSRGVLETMEDSPNSSSIDLIRQDQQPVQPRSPQLGARKVNGSAEKAIEFAASRGRICSGNGQLQHRSIVPCPCWMQMSFTQALSRMASRNVSTEKAHLCLLHVKETPELQMPSHKGVDGSPM